MLPFHKHLQVFLLTSASKTAVEAFNFSSAMDSLIFISQELSHVSSVVVEKPKFLFVEMMLYHPKQFIFVNGF